MTQIDKYKIEKPNVIFDFKCKSNGRMTHGPGGRVLGAKVSGICNEGDWSAGNSVGACASSSVGFVGTGIITFSCGISSS